MHVVFDFDGTLVDSLPALVRAYNTMAAQRGFTLMTDESIAQLRRLEPRARVKLLKVRWYQLPAIATYMKRAAREALPHLRCFTGVPDMLARLHASGAALGIVSSNAVDNIQAFADRAALPPLADVRSAGLFSKHRVLRRYMRHHRLTPAELIYVGDELRDALACRKVGVRMIGVTWGADRREDFARCPPTVFADAPADVLAAVRELA